jgi:Holliday junction resolvase
LATAANVTLETENVDITVVDGKKTILIEIKTDPNPRAAIREAIGQLLEYAYYRSLKAFGVLELVVIAPGTAARIHGIG